MLLRTPHQLGLLTGLAVALLLFSGRAAGHVVPSMTIEADFASDRSYTLRVNVDPRTFLAENPTTLPPVPASWYREQTPEQIKATKQKAQDYLSRALGVWFGDKKNTLTVSEIQAIDGNDNTPIQAETQEVHLLATVIGSVPEEAESFRIEFAKDANTSLILLHSQNGKSELRPQVIFPGETSRAFQLDRAPAAVATITQPPPPVSNRLYLVITLAITCILIMVGWRLLNRYRHHHRAHQKPRSM